jgi:hypothetical protein
MRISYRGAVALGELVVLPVHTPPSIRRKWISDVEYYLKNVKLNARQRARLSGLLRLAKLVQGRRVFPYGMYENDGTPASRGGKLLRGMPFGTWYLRPKGKPFGKPPSCKKVKCRS